MKPEPAQKGILENEQESQKIEEQMVNEDIADLGPAQEAQLEAYRDNATIVIFDEKTQPAILQSLQSSKDPVESIGDTAFLIHKQMESSLLSEGEKMTEITMALGAAHIVSELVVLAEAAQLYTLSPDQRLLAYRHGLTKYFEAGLKDGSIDPVELQKTVEPLLTEEQRQYGMQQMEQGGVSKTAPPSGMFNRPQQGAQPVQQGPQGILGGGNE